MGTGQDYMTRQTNGPGERSDEIRNDIEHTRRDMDKTIDQLGERLQPRHLLDDFLDWLQTSQRGSGAKDTIQSIGSAVLRQIRENPVPSMLIGAGLAWMAFSGEEEHSSTEHVSMETEGALSCDIATGATYGESFDETEGAEQGSTAQRMGEMAQKAKEGVASAADAAQRAVSGTAGAVSGAAGTAARSARRMAGSGQHMAARAGHTAERVTSGVRHAGASITRGSRDAWHAAGDRFETAMDDYPLAVGLGFLAAGVLAGLALPSTRREDEMLGPISDEVKQQAREQGKELFERGRHVAEATVAAVQEETEAQGITPGQIAEKAKEAASHIQEAATEAARETAKEVGLTPDQLKGEAERSAESLAETAQEKSQESFGETAPHQPPQPHGKSQC